MAIVRKCKRCGKPATQLIKHSRTRIYACEDHSLLEPDPFNLGQERIAFSALLALNSKVLLVPSMWEWERL